MREKNRLSVCVLGLRGYPHSYSAKINRYLSINHILTSSGHQVLIVNKEFTKEVLFEQFDNGTSIKAVGSLPCSIRSYTLAKYLRKITSFLDFFAILRHNRLRKIDFIILYTYSFYSICWYYLYSKIFRSKLILDYVERRSQMEIRKKFLTFRFNDFVFEKYAFRFLDAAFVISDYLKNELLEFIDEKKIYTLPPLSDFSYFDSVKANSDTDYILYCGTTDYRRVADFIVEAYTLAGVQDRLKLVMVLSGDPGIVGFYRKKIQEIQGVEFYSDIPREELIGKYKGAKGLLIPMRPVVQDMARFPQKVSEYVASRSVIISNAIGEIGHYFKHNENALLANDYSEEAYATLLKQIAEGVFDLERIAANSYELGINVFSETSHIKPLKQFLLSLKN